MGGDQAADGADHGAIQPDLGLPACALQIEADVAALPGRGDLDLLLVPGDADVVLRRLGEEGHLDVARLRVGLEIGAQEPVVVVERGHPGRGGGDVVPEILGLEDPGQVDMLGQVAVEPPLVHARVQAVDGKTPFSGQRQRIALGQRGRGQEEAEREKAEPGKRHAGGRRILLAGVPLFQFIVAHALDPAASSLPERGREAHRPGALRDGGRPVLAAPGILPAVPPAAGRPPRRGPPAAGPVPPDGGPVGHDPGSPDRGRERAGGSGAGPPGPCRGGHRAAGRHPRGLGERAARGLGLDPAFRLPAALRPRDRPCDLGGVPAGGADHGRGAGLCRPRHGRDAGPVPWPRARPPAAGLRPALSRAGRC